MKEQNSPSASPANTFPKPLNSILLVDDDEITNFYNKHVIEKMGVALHVHAELHGGNAMRYLTEKTQYSDDYQEPQLILLDINMPIMNGFEFLEAYEAASTEQRGQARIVMLTSSMLDMDRNRAHKFPSLADYFSKPMNETALKQIMEKHFS